MFHVHMQMPPKTRLRRCKYACAHRCCATACIDSKHETIVTIVTIVSNMITDLENFLRTSVGTSDAGSSSF